MNVKSLLTIIAIAIILVFVWLVFNPSSPEMRTKHKETLLKKGIEKSVEEFKEIEKQIQR